MTDPGLISIDNIQLSRKLQDRINLRNLVWGVENKYKSECSDELGDSAK